MTEPVQRKSDLGVRVASAVVMVAVAGTALWLGGWIFSVFVILIALGVLWEWRGLTMKLVEHRVARFSWLAIGLVYVGSAAYILIELRNSGIRTALLILTLVVAVDIGAYFAGRTIGGPKIAPKISPSKTWAGLFGGALAAAAVVLVVTYAQYRSQFADHAAYVRNYGIPDDWEFSPWRWQLGGLFGAATAIVAQTGDFFESWMKRRAGVKDSGALIPGHGGLLDRVDGLIAVLFVLGLIALSEPLWQTFPTRAELVEIDR